MIGGFARRSDPSDRAVAGLAAVPSGEPMLAVQGLSVSVDETALVIDADFAVRAGETLCLVGESGSGKSLTCLALMGLIDAPLRRTARRIDFLGEDVSAMSERRLAAIRGRDLAMIFQDAAAALNPVRRVGRQIAEVLEAHEGLTARQAAARAIELMAAVGIDRPRDRARAYPHELSGGMCQRVMIAAALSCRPRLLIADEATTALDVTTQAQILRLIRELQDESGMGVVFVTHDLGVVAEVATHVAVMYAGRIVETAGVAALFHAPRHPYTQALMRSRLSAHEEGRGRIDAIEGTVPAPSRRPAGCAFRPRCRMTAQVCERTPPLLPAAGGDHRAACHFSAATATGLAA